MSNILDTPFSHDSYESVSANGNVQYLIKKSSVGKQQAITDVMYVQAQSGTGNVFATSNAMTSYLLPVGDSNEVDIVEKLILFINIQNNSTTAACALLPVAIMLNRYELMQGQQIELLYSQHLIEYRLFWGSANDEDLVSNQINENYSYSETTGYGLSSSTLAASARQDYFLELPSLLSIAQPALRAIKSQLTLNCYWNLNPFTTTSASNLVSMTNSRIYICGYRWEQAVANKIYARYASLGHYMFYNSFEYTLLPNQSLNSVSKSSTPLTVFSSRYMSEIVLSITRNSPVQEQQLEWGTYPLYQIDEKSGGYSLFSDSLYSEIYREFEKEMIYTTAVRSTNIYVLPHSTDVFKCIGAAKNTVGPSQRGGFNYNPNIVLELLTTTWSASVQVCVTGHAHCILKVQNGSLTKLYV